MLIPSPASAGHEYQAPIIQTQSLEKNVPTTDWVSDLVANHQDTSSGIYRWLRARARLQYLQCISNGDTAVLH